MTAFRQAFFILAAVLLAAIGTHFLHSRAPAWYMVEEPVREDEVTMQDISTRWNHDVLWIDARPRSEFEAGHIPGALLLNEQEADNLLFEYFEKLQDNDKPIIIYCDSADCQASQKIKQYLLERLPLTNLYILKGGWEAWQQGQKQG